MTRTGGDGITLFLVNRDIGEAIQVYGGIGIMKEHDLGLFLRRCRAASLNLGYPEGLKEIIADELGL